jgi:hypothetical protein
VEIVPGVVATRRGLRPAVDLGAAAITIMSIATPVLAFVRRADATSNRRELSHEDGRNV